MYQFIAHLIVSLMVLMGFPKRHATSARSLSPHRLMPMLFNAILIAFGLRSNWLMPPFPIAGGANPNLLSRNLEWKMKPLGPLISTVIGFNGLCALGTGTNTLTRAALNGGAVRLTQDTNEAADVVFSGPLAFQLNKCGLLILEARVRLNTSLTSGAFYIGMQDIITTGQLSYENGSIVSTPVDGFAFLYEQEQSATQYYTVGVGNDVDDTIRISTNADALVLATFITVRIEADCTNGSTGADSGVVRYRVFVDGKLMLSAGTDARGFITSKCRSSVVLAPVIGICGRATAHTFDIAEFECAANIGDALD